jgi:hypothetical protein
MHRLAAAALVVFDKLKARDPALAARFLRDLKAATGYVDAGGRVNNKR